jgi:hypothetical protein
VIELLLLLPQVGYEWTSEIAQRLPGAGAAFLSLGWLRLARDDANL